MSLKDIVKDVEGVYTKAQPLVDKLAGALLKYSLVPYQFSSARELFDAFIEEGYVTKLKKGVLIWRGLKDGNYCTPKVTSRSFP